LHLAPAVVNQWDKQKKTERKIFDENMKKSAMYYYDSRCMLLLV